jgi:RND family efflux transporter MFP subunit
MVSFSRFDEHPHQSYYMTTRSHRSPTMTRCRKAVSILLAAAATAGSALSFAQEKPAGTAPQPEARAKAARGHDTPVFEVKPGLLRIFVIEPGSLEASRSQDVYCNVEGGTTIIRIMPEGQRVKKGDVVCELDSAAIRDWLVKQRITAKSAEANFINAKLTREVAEIKLSEYEKGILPQRLRSLEGEVRAAQTAIQKAEERWDRLMRARKRLDKILSAKREDTTATEIVADLDINDRLEEVARTLSLQGKALEQARGEENVYRNYTKDKTLTELRREVEKARSDELAKQATWEMEKRKEDRLEREIANCTLTAPIDGMVAYANDPNRMFGSNQSQIEEGARVRERQRIFRLPDLAAPWQVNAKVREMIVARVAPGQRVRVRVLGLPEADLTGVVVEVAPLPDAGAFFQSDLKVYTTRIRLEKNLPGFRLGSSAQVEMLLTDLDDVLSVPFQAILEHKDKDYVYLITPDGPERREVRLGMFNDTMIEVTEGLREGDKVALDPIALMAETELREAFAVSKEARARKAAPAVAAVDPRVRTQMFRKLQNLSPEDRRKLYGSASDPERKAILKKGVFTDEEVQVLEQMRRPSAPTRGPGSSLGQGKTPR